MILMCLIFFQSLPGFFNKFGCIYVEGLAEKVPECIGGVGEAFGGFHYYAFVFRRYNEFVANFNAKLRANALGYSNLILSGHFYLFIQINSPLPRRTSVVLKTFQINIDCPQLVI